MACPQDPGISLCASISGSRGQATGGGDWVKYNQNILNLVPFRSVIDIEVQFEPTLDALYTERNAGWLEFW